MTTLLWAGICDVFILGGLFLLGTLALRVILGRVDRLATISLSFGLGAGLFAWLLFILSWAGVPLNKDTILGSYAVILITLAVLARRFHLQPAEQTPRGKSDGKIAVWTTRGLWVVILLVIAVIIFLAVGLSYFGWDDIARWAVKGYGIALQGTVLAAANWGGVGLSYPLNIPILISIFRILDGDLLPGSKLIYPVFYASLLIGCYRFWVLQSLRKWAASLGVLLLASTPILFTHAYMGYANLPFTFYLVSGLLWSIEGMQAGGTGKALLGGTLLAIAVLTRPEGLDMLLVSVVALGIARLLTASGRLKLLPLLLPAVILAVPWYLFQRLNSTLNVEVFQYSSLALKGLLAGDIRWSALYTIVRYIAGQVIRFRDWGFTIPLLGLFLVAGLRPRDLRHDFTRSTLFFLSIGLFLIVFGSAYMAAYAPGGPAFLYDWISTTLMRSFMPVVICLTLLGWLLLREKKSD
ncbi:MAG TPA: hypothetical protein VII93_13840 [Anaerolineales bacterium]